MTAAAILARKVALGVWWCGAERRELHLRLLTLSVEAGPEDTRAEGHVRGRRRDKIVADTVDRLKNCEKVTRKRTKDPLTDG